MMDMGSLAPCTQIKIEKQLKHTQVHISIIRQGESSCAHYCTSDQVTTTCAVTSFNLLNDLFSPERKKRVSKRQEVRKEDSISRCLRESSVENSFLFPLSTRPMFYVPPEATSLAHIRSPNLILGQLFANWLLVMMRRVEIKLTDNTSERLQGRSISNNSPLISKKLLDSSSYKHIHTEVWTNVSPGLYRPCFYIIKSSKMVRARKNKPNQKNEVMMEDTLLMSSMAGWQHLWARRGGRGRRC